MRHILSNALTAITGGEFAIYGTVANAEEYEERVVFNDPSKKPSWETVQAEVPNAKWNYVRRDRNVKLTRSDWTQLADSQLTKVKRDKWKAYRQALRDITKQANPDNVDWPTAPEA